MTEWTKATGMLVLNSAQPPADASYILGSLRRSRMLLCLYLHKWVDLGGLHVSQDSEAPVRFRPGTDRGDGRS